MTNAFASSRRLAEAGVDKRLAAAIAEELAIHAEESTATKIDLATAKTELDGSIAAAKTEAKEDVTQLERKIDSAVAQLDRKIDKLDRKFDATAEQLDRKIEVAVAQLDRKIEVTAAQQDKKFDKKFDALVADNKITRAENKTMKALMIGLYVALAAFYFAGQ